MIFGELRESRYVSANTEQEIYVFVKFIFLCFSILIVCENLKSLYIVVCFIFYIIFYIDQLGTLQDLPSLHLKYLITDVSYNVVRLYLPECLGQIVFERSHNTFHPAINETVATVSKKYFRYQ